MKKQIKIMKFYFSEDFENLNKEMKDIGSNTHFDFIDFDKKYKDNNTLFE